MPLGDLTTVATVKAWRSPPLTTDGDDARVRRIISAVSSTILQDLNRRLLSTSYTETRDGDGGRQLLLEQWPVTSVAAVEIDGGVTVIPQSTSADPSNAGFAGWLLDAPSGSPVTGKLMLRGGGFRFNRGLQNVQIQYTAGFLAAAEPQTVPASGAPQIPAAGLALAFAADAGVAYAAGGALAAVAASPAPGQYIAPRDVDGAYVFNAADANAALLISYSYTPADIVQAATELAIMRINESGHIGSQTQNLAGETVSWFTRAATTSAIDSYLAPYRKILL
jgi:hypothetical protein